MNMDFTSIIDLIILICGFYCIYTAYLMKTNREIKAGWLISSQINIEACKDKDGYIDFMWKRTVAFGIIVLIYSGVGLINSYVTPLNSVIVFGSMGVFFIALIWFAVLSSKSVKRFF